MRHIVSDAERADLTDRILGLLADRGAESYVGEPVTQLEHALQTAALAEDAGAPDALVVAALLHDIGHLLHGLAEDLADQGVDARHEDVGDRWLSAHFGRAVTEPIRLHVAAKRYLCAVEPAYAASLSGPSRESLALQGGPMAGDEARAFAQTPWGTEASALRRWDDAAKVPGRDVPGLRHYRGRIEQLLERP
jgi:[1-hydroxy-2-(trimethylamino)ethyl]phosphonate dioxygenase